MKHPFRYLALALICSGQPVSAENNQTLISQADLVRIGAFGWAAPDLQIPSVDYTLPLVKNDDTLPGAAFLNSLAAKEQLSGLNGLIYDNHDRGHSMLPRDLFPGLVYLQYGPDLKAQGLHNGAGGQITLPAIVIGNSSTVRQEGKLLRSHMRVAMTAPFAADRAYFNYTNNHIYLYPEHRDHDAVDRYPANWAYMLTSQGSSRSDQPFIKALIMTLAAFPKNTRDFLEEQKLVMPTLQMILRRSQQYISTPDQYLSGAAHPTVFSSKRLMPERMIALANSMRPGDIPPMVKLDVTDETFSGQAGLAGMSEVLFDTPSAIARVWRSLDYRQDMTVTAQNTTDPNGRALEFEWVLLRGNPQLVRITQDEGSDTQAHIQVDWHDERSVFAQERRLSSRVDIGVFAWNGVHYSAPAIISITFPTHQTRVYGPELPDGNRNLVSIDYTRKEGEEAPDPWLFWVADWQDKYTYDENGALLLWIRAFADGHSALRGLDAEGTLPPREYVLDNLTIPARLFERQSKN